MIYVSSIDRNTEENVELNFSRTESQNLVSIVYRQRSLTQEGHKPTLMENSNLPTACCHLIVVYVAVTTMIEVVKWPTLDFQSYRIIFSLN